MTLELIFGAGIFALLLLVLINTVQAKEGKHFLIRLLVFFFVVFCGVLIGKASLDSTTQCESLVNSTTIVDNTTSYTYDTVCITSDNNTGLTFFRLTLSFMLLFFLYVFIFYFYTVLNWFKGVIYKR